MPNWEELDWLLGRRFVCDFRVASIGAVPAGGAAEDRTVTLYMYGEQCEITYGELRALIESGFVVEVTH